MDRPDFVLTKRETPSTWAVAAPPRQCFATNPHKNAAQSRIGGIDRQACDQIEMCCRRVLADPNRPSVRKAVSKHVPMGESLPQGTQRDRAAPETLTEDTSQRNAPGQVSPNARLSSVPLLPSSTSQELGDRQRCFSRVCCRNNCRNYRDIGTMTERAAEITQGQCA